MSKREYQPANLARVMRKYDGQNFRQIDFLRRMKLQFTVGESKRFFHYVSNKDLENILDDPPISNTLFEVLSRMQLLPTPAILESIAKYGGDEIEREIAQIEAGHFEYGNRLQTELEYSRYWREPDAIHNLDSFSDLPWIEGKKVIIGDREHQHAQRNAEQAVAVLKEIEARKTSKKLVIGNIRYGMDWIVIPIESELKKRGIDIAYEYMPSTNYTFSPNGRSKLELENIDLIEQYEEVIVVDGTHEPVLKGLTRFPAAMWGYLNALKDHTVEFWSPQLTPEVYVGYVKFRQTRTGSSRLIIMSSTSEDHCRLNAPFDDPENYAASKTRGFTRYGFTTVRIAESEHDFVKAIQDIMKPLIEKELG